MGLLTPYVGLKNEELIGKYRGVSRFLAKIFPTLKLAPFPVKKGEEPKAHYLHFLKDPLMNIKKIPVHNIVVGDEAIRVF